MIFCERKCSQMQNVLLLWRQILFKQPKLKESSIMWTSIVKEPAYLNRFLELTNWDFKGALSGVRQFLATESPLKIMKNGFYFTSKRIFALRIFKFLPWLFGHFLKRLDKKDKVNFKFCDVTAWLTNSCNTHWRISREI